MKKKCARCSVKKDFDRLGFTMPGNMEKCLTCQTNEDYTYSKDQKKGCKGNIKLSSV